MGFSLKGLITGIATTAGDIMDEERKQTNALIAQRTKNSFENYNKYQETTEALRADIKKRDAQLLNFQPDLNEEERIAAAGVPNLVDMYQQMLAQGKQVTVRDMIKVSKNAAGMKFDNYVSELGKIKPTETPFAPVSTKFFGPSEESQRKMGEKIAMATGVSESELRGFERMPATATVPSMGSINTEVFKKEPKKIESVEEAAQMANLDRLNAERKFGKDSQEYKLADDLYKQAFAFLEKPKELLGGRKDRLIQEKIDSKDPARIKDIDTELEKIYDALKTADRLSKDKTKEEKQETYNAINTSVNAYVNTRMREDEGASWRKYVDYKVYKDPDDPSKTFISRTQKAEMPPEEQRKMFATERALAKQALISNGFASPTGVPLYDTVARIMNDRNISVGPAPAPDATPAPAPAATPAATPAAKVVSRATVEAQAAKNKVTFEVAAEEARKQGYTIR